MFKRLKMTFGSNTALALLGVNTQSLNTTWRQGCQEIGMAQGWTPKELAVAMLFQLPSREVDWQHAEEVISKWVNEGKIRPEFVAKAKLEGAALDGNLGR